MMNIKNITLISTLTLLTFTAQAETKKTADEMAAELSNPANSNASLGSSIQIFQHNGDLPGANEQTTTQYLFQPAIPFKINDSGKNLLFRPAIPLSISQPAFGNTGFEDEDWVLGDIGYDLVYAGTSKTGTIFGWGIAGTLPTGHSNTSGEQFRVGPEIFFGTAKKWGVLGALLNHQIDVSDNEDRGDFSKTSMQYFYAFPIGNGQAIGSGPIISYDHEAESGQRLTFPIGIGWNKTVVSESGAINKFAIDVQYFVKTPDAFAPQWLLKLSWTPVVALPW